MTDELEALFDKISDEQRTQADEVPAAPSSEAESSEDDLEALFDALSAETQSGATATTPAENPVTNTAPSAAATGGAESSEDELEALFDALSAEVATVPAAETAPEAAQIMAAAATSDTENLEDKPMFDRIGSILRQLHDSMRELGYDRALQDVTTEVVDAKGRLEYVATLTEQAATRVLNSIDVAMPQQEDLSKTARNLEERWTALFEGNMDIDAFKQLAQDSRDFAVNTANRADEEKARLMEIMMAQDFQDITGQVIKKVVVITKKLEQELAQMLLDNAPPESREKGADLMSGPDVPGKAMGQDDVDGLLASLGF